MGLTTEGRHLRRRSVVGRGRDRVDRRALKRDLVDLREEGELGLHPLHLEHVVHLLGRERALQLLPLEDLPLDVVERLGAARRRVRLGALAVAAAVAGGDEVRDAARLEERVVLRGERAGGRISCE